MPFGLPMKQTVSSRYRGKGLARTCCHLYQCLGAVIREGLIQVVDGVNLALTEAVGVQRREVLHIVPNGIGLP